MNLNGEPRNMLDIEYKTILNKKKMINQRQIQSPLIPGCSRKKMRKTITH